MLTSAIFEEVQNYIAPSIFVLKELIFELSNKMTYNSNNYSSGYEYTSSSRNGVSSYSSSTRDGWAGQSSNSRYGDSSSRRYGANSNGYNNNNRYESGSYGYTGGNNSFGGELNQNIQWDLSSLPHFEKNFYYEHPDVAKLSEREIEEWRKENQVTVNGKGVPKMVRTFDEGSFPGLYICIILNFVFSFLLFLCCC